MSACPVFIPFTIRSKNRLPRSGISDIASSLGDPAVITKEPGPLGAAAEPVFPDVKTFAPKHALTRDKT